MNSTTQHDYNFAMQKYMLLQEQHQELCTHLDQIRPRMSPANSSSPSLSPTRYSPSSSASSVTSTSSSVSPRRHRSSGERRHSRTSGRLGGLDISTHSLCLDTIPDEETLYEISAEENRLFDVNEGIKRALTELLNSSTVRGDMNMRMWVQTRLMETEKELRSGRRRRSSATTD